MKKTQPVRNKQTDLRPSIDGMKWTQGENVVFRDRKIKLVAEFKAGKVVGVTPINLSGKAIQVTKQSGSSKGPRPRPCIICYNLDSPLGSRCIEVPCWLLPLLKPVLNPKG